MHAAIAENSYTESVGTKVKPEMAAGMREAAEAAGVKQGEWLRKVIGAAIKQEVGQRIVLAELMALRTLTLTLNSSQWRGKEITDAQLKEIVDGCEVRKFAQADKRIQAGREAA